jgi:alkanesulfonate monooxygenase SsuD/methylene tetrahydromethanopterin reductase-like flavin-dependent oxidoreductase (luciferase family)
VKLGLFLSAQFKPDDPLSARIAEMDRQILDAERLGFESLVLGHHYLARSAFLQPIPLAGYLAGMTSRIKIIFGVLLAPLLNPLALAEDIATLDALSGGRVIVGLGAGYRTIEFKTFGASYENRFKTLEQYVPLLRALWSGEEVTATGAFGELSGAKIEIHPHSPEGPPIWIGAFGDIGIRRAARLDAAWLAGPEGDDEALLARLEMYRHWISTILFSSIVWLERPKTYWRN